MVRILTTKHLPVLEQRLGNLHVAFSRLQRYGRESWSADRRSPRRRRCFFGQTSGSFPVGKAEVANISFKRLAGGHNVRMWGRFNRLGSW